jgi:aspartyl-tRNA(Asn)/glutamyl-tRNA(Gln) amidotransferase subunit B
MRVPPLIRGYEVVIGLETHTQLSTASKIFSGASTAFGAAPNTQACPVDLALPGTLPVMNRGAVERAIRFGLAVDGQIAALSIFARKNYFYPDLPKGYQISQYELPVVQGGAVAFLLDGAPHQVRLTRAHLEEDAGKSVHDAIEGMSGIDLNRAGTPLLEIVSEPDMRSSKEAVEYARALHALVVWLGICDGNMQEGSFRCDANVSVRRPGAPFGTRREVKNLNSFRFLQQAIDFEIQWQIDQIEDGLAIRQATVLFDPASGETRMMRSKEDAHDYRYFPDPDLPPLVIEPAWIERVRGEMPELPRAMAARFEREYGFPTEMAAQLTADIHRATHFESFWNSLEAALGPASTFDEAKIKGASWAMVEMAALLNEAGLSILEAKDRLPPEMLGRLVARVIDGTVNHRTGKVVFSAMFGGEFGGDPDKIIEAKGLKQMSDTSELDRIVDDVLAANPKSVEEYRAGKEKAFNALVGQAMKASKGKANPAQVNELLKKKLG